MKQTFITLGEGLTDLFEFMTMIEYNHQRIDKIIYFHSPQAENKKSSVAIIINLHKLVIIPKLYILYYFLLTH